MSGAKWSFRPVLAVVAGAVLLVSGCSAGKDAAGSDTQSSSASTSFASASPSVTSSPTASPAIASSSPVASEAAASASETSEGTVPSVSETSAEVASPAAETPVQAIQPPVVNPAEAAPGTSCGPSSTGASTLVVAANGTEVTCDQVRSVFSEFNATFTSGDTSNYQIQGFTCHTRSQEDVSYESRSVTCKQGGTRLEAMTEYPLGGIPVEDVYSYRVDPSGQFAHTFSTEQARCMFSVGAKAGEMMCSRTVGDPMSISLRTDTDGPIVKNESFLSGADSQDKPLPAGHSITVHGHTCINNGSSLTCQSFRGGFTLDATSYSTF
ncbi:hypothetical protein [Rothia nasimurium]|uniref:hypothetical protein n=1 Tax=Rothia nasimurium TaxID=85336 RepID=UPI001F453C3C|nr:hypothetical protein [Rothia nasimurium]